MDIEQSTSAKVFIAYSKQDKEWMDVIRFGLNSRSCVGKLSVWSDVCIDAGTDWEHEIREALKEADAALLLVSTAFLETPFIQHVEIPLLQERQLEEQIPIIPVPVRASEYLKHPILGRLESYRKDPQPLADMIKADRDQAIRDLCNQLLRTLSPDRPWSANESAIRTRLRVLAVFPRPISLGNTSKEPAFFELDLRTEWAQLVDAVKARQTLALLRLRPPTLERLLDELMALGDADNYPHVVYLSAFYSAGEFVFEDQFGQPKHVSFESFIRDLSSINRPLPLLACRLLARQADSLPGFALPADSPVRNVVLLPRTDISRHEARSWADLFSRLTYQEVRSAFDKAFPGEDLTFLHNTPGLVLPHRLTAKQSYINEGVSIKNLPVGSRHFLGRNLELSRIACGMGANRLTLITGMTGLGGKSLALEATYRNAWRFPGRIAIFDAEHQQGEGQELTEESIIARLAEELDIDRRLGIESEPDADRLTQIRRLLEEGDYLFVFLCMEIYTARQPNGLNRLLDLIIGHEHRSHCIIETKENLFLSDRFESAGINRIQLNPLSTEEATSLVRILAHDDPKTIYIADDEDRIKKLARLSQGYPKILVMALGLARSLLFDEILEELSENTGRIAEQIDSLVERVVTRLDDDARMLLRSLQLFPARSMSSFSVSSMRKALKLKDIASAIHALVDTNLIHLDTNVQRYYWDEVVRIHAGKEPLDRSLQQAIDRELIKVYSGDDTLADPERLRKALKQGESAVNILAVVKRTMEIHRAEAESSGEIGQLDLRSIAFDLARQAQRRGLEFAGQHLLQAVMEICRDTFDGSRPDDQTDLAALLYDIASVEQTQGEYKMAEDHYQKSFDINEAADSRFGKARSLHGLGRLHHDRGEYAQARACYQESLELREKGRDQGDEREHEGAIAQLYHELARLAHDEGRFEDARKLHERTLEIRERRKDVDERGLAATQYELGRLAQDRGEWDQAEHWYRESERHWQSGSYWIGLGIVKHALASLSSLRGRGGDAYEGFTTCLEIQRRAGDKRGVAATLAQLGMLELRNLNINIKQAEAYFTESEQMQREAHNEQGEMIARIGRALVQQAKDDFVKAERILSDVHRRCKDAGNMKLAARSGLLLGSLKLVETKRHSLDERYKDHALDNLQTALKTALEIGDRCTEAVAKVRLGELKRLFNEADDSMEKEGLGIMAQLLGHEVGNVDDACNLFGTLC